MGNRIDREWKVKGAGGTSGGIGSFLLGLGLALAGAYLLLDRVQVTIGYWLWWGPSSFGLTLVPLLLGIGLLFFNGRSIAGWVLSGGGVIIVFAGILTNLRLILVRTSLFEFLVMCVLFVGGLGLIARSLRSSGDD